MLLPTNVMGQDGEMNREEDASLACTTSWKHHQEYSGTKEFERPLTRARKRHMAHVSDGQPYIQPIPKRRKNL